MEPVLSSAKRHRTGPPAEAMLDITSVQKAISVVGRIIRPQNEEMRGSKSTGVLIQPGLLLTNAHALPTYEVCEISFVELFFDRQDSEEGQPPFSATSVRVWLDPSRFFATSTWTTGESATRGALDYTLVGLDDLNSTRVAEVLKDAPTLSEWTEADPSRVFIVQHPRGGPKKMSEPDEIVESADCFVRYAARTDSGSSGSPVMANSAGQLKLFALHRSASDRGNEGVRINAIIEDLKQQGLLDRIHRLAPPSLSYESDDEAPYRDYQQQRYESAFAKLSTLCEANDPKAYLYRGLCYEEGKGVELDLEKALQQFSLASKLAAIQTQNHVDNYLDCSVMLLHRATVTDDVRKSSRIAEWAAQSIPRALGRHIQKSSERAEHLEDLFKRGAPLADLLN